MPNRVFKASQIKCDCDIAPLYFLARNTNVSALISSRITSSFRTPNYEQPTRTKLTRTVFSATLTSDDVGRWVIQEEKDPIDDSHIIYVALESLEKGDGLMLRNTAGYVEIYVGWDEYMGFDEGYNDLIMRLDSNTAETVRWNASTNRRGLFHKGNKLVIVNVMQKHINTANLFGVLTGIRS